MSASGTGNFAEVTNERLPPLDVWVEDRGAIVGASHAGRAGTASGEDEEIVALGVDLMVPQLPPSEGYVLAGSGMDSSAGVVTEAGGEVSDRGDDDAESWLGSNNGVGARMTMTGEDKQQEDWSRLLGGARTSAASSRRSSYGNSNSDSVGRLSIGGGRSDREEQQQQQQQQQRQSLLVLSNKHHQHHSHHQQQHKTSAGSSGLGTPSRPPSERLSLDSFDGPPSGAVSAAAASILGGVNGSGNRNSAPSPPLGNSSGRSSLGGVGARARGAGRASPLVSSPRSVSPGRRGSGGGGGGCAGPGSSPKKQGRRSNDSQTLGRKSVDSLGGVSHNFKVVIRVRPPLPREVDGERMFQNIVSVDKDEHVITISENLNAILDEDGSVISAGGPYSTHAFTFDHVYDVSASQKKVYDTTAMEVVDSSLQGYNATVFAYGQTGTGKTFTMEGFKRGASAEDRGIIPRAIEQVFAHIQRNASPRMRFLVRASYLQIYNEQISDLLKPERTNLTIREDKKRGVFVEGLSEWVVRTPGEIYGLMERGGQLRATGATRMNDTSSRSHAVFIIIVEQSETCYTNETGEEMSPDVLRQRLRKASSHEREALLRRLEKDARQTFKVGKLNLVDLAGSERVRLSGATGQRLQESKKINQSLSALGNVISALTDHRGRQHIPYRDSKLTRILEDSLGGNCKTTMMAMISPALESMVETLSTVKFASRAKNIKNQPIVNEDFDQKSLLRKYERELKRLRAELEERSRNLVDKRQLLFVEGERRRAEADKMAAIRALEERSLEFQREKEEKRQLEGRIAMLTGQMIGRGRRADGGAQGADYADRLADLERERNTIELEKEQVERYKQLLMKQRDIMIALTQRLNERDDAISALNDELDANESHQELIEDALDMRTQQLFHLQKALVLHSGSAGEGREGGVDQPLSQALGGWKEALSTAAAATGAGAPTTSSSSSTPKHLQQQQRPFTAPTPATVSSSPANNLNVRGGGAGGGARLRKGEMGASAASAALAPSSLHRFAGSTVNSCSEPTSDGTRAIVAATAHAERSSPRQEDLITFRRFKPHALMQPTLFSTDDPAGGVSLHDADLLAGGDGEQGGEGDRGGGAPGGGGGRGGKGNEQRTGETKLLNAWEKIEELEGLVESSRSHNDRLLEDLEEVQTDKVSMEYLLREKLERLVQSEIEARVARMHQDGGVDEILRRQLDGLRVEASARVKNEAVLREEIKRLKRSSFEARKSDRHGSNDDRRGESAEVLARTVRELDGVRAENIELKKRMESKDPPRAPDTSAQSSPLHRRGSSGLEDESKEEVQGGTEQHMRSWTGGASNEESSDGQRGVALQSRCEALLGERKAMQTIMEQKVQVLVDNVADSASAVLNFVAGAGDTHGSGYDGVDPSSAQEHTGPSSAGAAETLRPTEGAEGGVPGSDTSPAARDAGRALSKDLGQLRRLVQAAINALRNAEIEDQQRAEGVGSPPQAAAVVESAGTDSRVRSPQLTPSDEVYHGRARGSGQVGHDDGSASAPSDPTAATATTSTAAAATAAATAGPAVGDAAQGHPQIAVHPSSALPPLKNVTPVADDSVTDVPAQAAKASPCRPLAAPATERDDPMTKTGFQDC